MTRRQLVYQVEQAWLEWVYWNGQIALNEQQLALLNQIEEKVRSRIELGEAPQSDLLLLKNTQLEIQGMQLSLSQHSIQAYHKVVHTTFLDTTTQLVFYPMEKMELNLNGLDTATLLSLAKAHINLADASLDQATAALAPQWSVGYFNQSIRPIYSLQGGIVQLSLPIDTRLQKATIQQKKLGVMVQNQEVALQAHQLNLQWREALQQWRILDQQFEEYGDRLMSQARDLREQAQRQYDFGAIDFLAYQQYLRTALNHETTYQQLIFQINQQVLLLHYLSN